MRWLRFLPEPTAMSRQVDLLLLTWTVLAAIAVVAIVGVMLAFAIIYRKGSKADRTHLVRGNYLIEWGWTIIPTAFFLGMFVWAARLYYEQYNPPPNALEIYVVGKQWMWIIEHPGGQRELNELHVPAGQAVKLVMTSQDVIHSFFLPDFRIKQDVLPGRFTAEWFRADEPGTYRLECSEFCGRNHARMRGPVVVMPPADYARWLQTTGPQTSLAQGGKRLFTGLGCAGCHLGGGTVRAPSLVGLYGNRVPLDNGGTVIADDSYIQDSILFPKKQVVASYKPVMPSFKGQVTPEQVLELIAYIKSLGAQEGSTP
ncbi:MAG TPA: cytochrome c oxidase subunit II [Oscillatoriaceae cyanobacterium]